MAKILVVEDDVELAALIGTWLSSEHYTVTICNSGRDGMEHINFYKFDAIILDWELPGITGIEICKEFRKRGGSAPLLMLTVRQNISDKEEGFGAGVDDYLTKPFNERELSARLRALLRRPSRLSGSILEEGDFSLDTVAYKVTRRGTDIQLSPLEFRVLEALMRNTGQPVSPEALIARVWGGQGNATKDTLRSCVKTLRQKTSLDGKESPIRTIRGQGYIFDPLDSSR